MGKLFGTDGIRGVVNAGLDAALAFQVGLATAQVLGEGKPGKKPLVTIGKDTRISSDLLEGALVAGLCSAGADVLHLGVIPTPAVAWITVDQGADAEDGLALLAVVLDEPVPLFLDDGLEEGGDILVVAVEGVAVDAAALHDVPDGDAAVGLLFQELGEGVGNEGFRVPHGRPPFPPETGHKGSVNHIG